MPAALKGQSREFTILGGGNKLHLKGKSGRYQLQLKRQSRETTILGGNKSSAITVKGQLRETTILGGKIAGAIKGTVRRDRELQEHISSGSNVGKVKGIPHYLELFSVGCQI